MITTFTKPVCKMLQTDIESALLSVAEKHGVEIGTASGSFRKNQFFLKLEINAKGDDGEFFNQAKSDFEMMATAYGLKPDDLGRNFIHDGKSFSITGLTPKRQKYPINVTRYDGKKFKFPTSLVVSLLANGG